MAELEGRKLGSCRLLKRLGEGGMGAVYLGRDEHLDREVAVKVIHPDLARDTEWLARFRIEAVAQARLSHPALVTIHAFSMEGDLPYLIMEYVNGSTLRDILRARGALPVSLAVNWIRMLLEGLACAHDHGVLHRDIKPGNILIAEDGRVKLGDFGIAKMTGVDGITRLGTALGTPLYAPPEQIRGERVGPQGDLYALGVTLFEMVTGRLPFRGVDTPGGDVRLAHLHTPPPSPSLFRRDLSPELDALLLRCLAKDPGGRYGSASDLLRALQDPRMVKDGRRGVSGNHLLRITRAPSTWLKDFRVWLGGGWGRIRPHARRQRISGEREILRNLLFRHGGRRLWLLLVPFLLILLILVISV